MTDSGGSARGPQAIEARTRIRIERAIGRARWVLLWESVWPVVAPLLVLAAVFATVSWFGLWRLVSDPVRIGILVAFAIAALALLFRTLRLRQPARMAALARVEQATGALHHPATAFSDRIAVGASDPAAEALWAAHRTRLLAALDRVRAGIPSPGMARRDPAAFRFLAILALVVAFLYAGPERGERLGEAFRGGEPAAVTLARIDAWVTPPAYTGRAPIFLTGEAAKPAGTVYSVPVGSVVTIRTGGAHDLDVIAVDGMEETVAEAVPPKTAIGAPPADQPLERQVKLAKAGEVAVQKAGRQVMAWRFAIEPDHAPKIAFAKPPSPTSSGALAFAYALSDDYGVVSANAEITPVDAVGGAAEARPLVEAPVVPLSLPQARTRDGAAETIRDLTSHPWAGARVKVTLVARDEAGQEGRSEPVEVVLPARQFTDPLARAVVEQRARLALDANAADRVADALDALTLAPEKTFDKAGDYLALRSAYRRLIEARDDDALRDMVDYLWAIALGIEDGDLSLAAQELRAAQDALRQALENGASDDEIARLTEQLREAMQKYLQALAQEAMRNPQISKLPPDANARMLRQQDLDRMLNQIENLAKNGARDAARQLLSELQNMLENLQAGRPMQGDQNAKQMMEALDKLADMIRRQQQLMDKTFQADRGVDPSGEGNGEMSQEELEKALRDLQQGQQGLEQQLKDLMAALEGMGMEPNGKLGQAGEAMGRAAGDLGKGNPGRAVGNQGAALDALRQGAQGLSQQLANQGPGGGGFRNGDQLNNEDPLGRPQQTTGPDLGTTVKVPDEIDIQRAREILELIRKRLGDPGRALIERDYLERLLDRF